MKAKGVNQFVNNVVYNWEAGAYILGGSERASAANISGNYFISGPGNAKPAFTRGNQNFSLFAEDNFQDSTRNGRLDGTLIPTANYGPVRWQSRPYAYPGVTPRTAAQAYAYVVAHAGASLRRDAVDRRLLQELTSLGKLGQIIQTENDTPMHGPGPLASGPAPPDTDQDGMPDAWEQRHGLNPRHPADRHQDRNHDGYSNLEEYLQEPTQEAAPARLSK
ncbi:hypothetical protein [Hymenobacter psychrotolerans]|uniref:Pectate lyase n=1 Tax=Hymenobacter psychrotolerans DSM 18569 TaxID=1121959 RepID=A0A1M6T9E4_9BACT|nr:hypothetical protein [Hymenobacter psychrotolerans]SHK53368.1 hypothetical protein SAMN02746009_01116 [Hymenobacter psychrotolerans DSM 18569]